jgi:hypothetical protein
MNNETWNESKPVREADLTTDDLVMMIGEAAVQSRAKDKVLKYQNKNIQDMQAEQLKMQSTIAGKEELTAEIESLKQQLAMSAEDMKKANQSEIESLKEAHLAEIEKMQISVKGKDTYVLQLENDCYKIALKRDELKKDLVNLQQEKADLEIKIKTFESAKLTKLTKLTKKRSKKVK